MRIHRAVILTTLLRFAAASAPHRCFRTTFPIARYTRVDVPDSKPPDADGDKKKPLPRVACAAGKAELAAMDLSRGSRRAPGR